MSISSKAACTGEWREVFAEVAYGENDTLQQVERMAKNAARAKAIEAAGVAVQSITGVKDAAFAFSLQLASARAITCDESWGEARNRLNPDQRSGGFSIRLRTRVSPHGQQGPGIAAELDRMDYVANEPIRVVIKSPVDAYVGVWAIDADDRVVRLWPTRSQGALKVTADHPLVLPPRGSTLASAPRRGQRQDQESLVVLASKEPELFTELIGAEAGRSPDVTSAQGVSFSDFSAALAELRLERIDIRFLPYVVKRSK